MPPASPRSRRFRLSLVLGAALLLAACAPVSTAPADYSPSGAWLCHPARADDCDTDLTATRIAPDGTLTREAWRADPAAPVDCFYVYPTASWDLTRNADLIPDERSERPLARQQAAPFGRVCRVFAPMYRQVPVAALVGLARQPDRELAYADVRAAWGAFRQQAGERPFVLIGHSQGAAHLIRLIREEIDGQEVQGRMLSALLLGMPVGVPAGQDVGGTFRSVPLCRAGGQTGCVITYASFRADAPPVGGPFTRPDTPGLVSACVNPAALAGGPADLTPYFRTTRTFPVLGPVQRDPGPWVQGAAVPTPYVTLPGFLRAECVQDRAGAGYLSVTVRADPADPRTDTLGGEVNIAGVDLPGWGLHLIDVDLALGDLIRVVQTQTRAYFARPGR
ncbi:DUF3089 domain-containing protein [Deinococcus ficus]|uniref:Lysophospholipase n=2 Tax=Deinococcus ficus TaxID=317577 RepID=A0A221SZ05_9DEIO|nr:DUF3089 domain-containing protein [Deinococcus ficus]ASN81885.1 hypothetical protein DFI_13615 [Deinococcus ficus]